MPVPRHWSLEKYPSTRGLPPMPIILGVREGMQNSATIVSHVTRRNT